MPKKLFNIIRDKVYSDFNENEQKIIIQDLITLLKLYLYDIVFFLFLKIFFYCLISKSLKHSLFNKKTQKIKN